MAVKNGLGQTLRAKPAKHGSPTIPMQPGAIKTFALKKEAEAFSAKVKVDVGRGINTSGRTTVAEAGETWIKSCNGLERSTVVSYRQQLDIHICPFIGTKRLSEVTTALVRAWMDRLTEEGRSRDAVRRAVGTLGVPWPMHRSAALWLRTPCDPFAEVGTRTGASGPSLRSAWTFHRRTRFRRMLAVAGTFRPFLVAVLTGL